MAGNGSKDRVGRAAGRQFGRVSCAQLFALGVSRGTMSTWIEDGYLHPRLPRVYAVGHAARSTESDLAEALLYAGPGAMLSHATAAWWLGLLEREPKLIHVSTPRQVRSLPGIQVHRRRKSERAWHRRLPTTPLPQIFLDLAATSPLGTVRFALANADYQGKLDLDAIEAALGPGCRGSKRLRQALERHRPELAKTKSRLERMFVGLCEAEGWPLPEINVYVGSWQVDALWRDERIAIELDGYGNHHSPAQLKRDRAKEMALRKAGFTPVRYSEEQLKQRTEVIADVCRLRDGGG